MEIDYVVGSVPYVNARPLVSYLEEEPRKLPVEVVYAVPSQLPDMLNEDVDAVLASSIDALIHPNRQIAAGLCIASKGQVLSVRLFSKVPPNQIKTLALDQSSLTSNALAKIILAENHCVHPTVESRPPHLEDMLKSCDACVLIGDIGMRTDGSGLHVLDLGEEWTRLTGLPFVWALWIGGAGLTEELAGYLLTAREQSPLGAGFSIERSDLERRDRQIASISSSSSWTFEEVRKYLTETIAFDLGEQELEGLREFSKKLGEHGIDAPYFPTLVQAFAARPERSASPR